MRSVFAMAVVATLVAANSVAAQTTSAPPAAAPAPAPSAPATGAPALAPTPGTPSPGGVTQTPAPSINSTPSQSNVDLYPPTRVLPNPAPSAGTTGAATPGQVPPGGVTQGRGPSGGAQKGGANDRNPVGSDLDDCMKLWGPETPSANRIGRERASAIKRASKSRSSSDDTARNHHPIDAYPHSDAENIGFSKHARLGNEGTDRKE
jgi:hypothetical protein